MLKKNEETNIGEQKLKLSRHFPREVPKCKNVTDDFFTCFLENGMQRKGSSDAEAGTKGLEHCKKKLLAYNECIDKVCSERKVVQFRVPEAYRVRQK